VPLSPFCIIQNVFWQMENYISFSSYFASFYAELHDLYTINTTKHCFLFIPSMHISVTLEIATMHHWFDWLNVGSYDHWLIDFHPCVAIGQWSQCWWLKGELGRTHPLSHRLLLFFPICHRKIYAINDPDFFSGSPHKMRITIVYWQYLQPNF
jgi:hypothetical protein